MHTVPRPVRAIKVTRGGLERAIANLRIIPTSLTGDVTSEVAEDDGNAADTQH